MELEFDLFLYDTAWICFNFTINVWDHKLQWFFIFKLWYLYNICHAGCWHIVLWIKKMVLPQTWLDIFYDCKISWQYRLHELMSRVNPNEKHTISSDKGVIFLNFWFCYSFQLSWQPWINKRVYQKGIHWGKNYLIPADFVCLPTDKEIISL